MDQPLDISFQLIITVQAGFIIVALQVKTMIRFNNVWILQYIDMQTKVKSIIDVILTVNILSIILLRGSAVGYRDPQCIMHSMNHTHVIQLFQTPNLQS